ncbi:MAG: hypothetical protein Q7T18_10745, partial [Sedimentisphaerales bacterium]|nr:hypothetical protein [Sedimentisphaerales bacterium]
MIRIVNSRAFLNVSTFSMATGNRAALGFPSGHATLYSILSYPALCNHPPSVAATLPINVQHGHATLLAMPPILITLSLNAL